MKPDTPLAGAALGFPAGPEDLFVDAQGEPVRIDKAFSWEYPLAVHGMMHNVIANAWRGDPYRIDTLMIFMANMAWNSSMRPGEARRMLNDRDANGEYRIPFLVVCDAFQSETTAFADLVLPDTTYLERHDVMSLLDRPISEFDGPTDSVRVPVLPPTGECRPFQDVLVELAGRLEAPSVHNPGRKPQVPRLCRLRRQLRDRARSARLPDRLARLTATTTSSASPTPSNGSATPRTTACSTTAAESPMRYMRNWNRGYNDWAQRARMRATATR